MWREKYLVDTENLGEKLLQLKAARQKGISRFSELSRLVSDRGADFWQGTTALPGNPSSDPKRCMFRDPVSAG